MAKRKEAHRAKFLQTAIRLFGSKGYHATTVPDIVREAGSSTGAFYFYFRNKEDVFASVLEFVGEQLAAALNKAIAGASENAISQMRAKPGVIARSSNQNSECDHFYGRARLCGRFFMKPLLFRRFPAN